MAEPKKRLTNTRSGNRKSHLAYKKQSLSTCSNCKSKVLPHCVCSNCGSYDGEQVLNMKTENKKNKK